MAGSACSLSVMSSIAKRCGYLSSKVEQRTHYDPAGRVLQQTIQRSTSPVPLTERRYRYRESTAAAGGALTIGMTRLDA